MSAETQVIDPAIEAAAEKGYPLPEAPARLDGLPPGSGKLVVPHFSTFSQVVNFVTRTYRWSADEALRHSHTNALAIRRDPIVMDAVRSRQIPVVQLPWHLSPIDDTDNRQVEAAKVLTQIVEDIPNFQTFKMHLAEAVFYGRYAVQNIYRWDYSRGQRRLVVADYKPINGDKLIFRYSGQAGVLVHPTMFEGETTWTDRGRAHFFTPEEREQVIIHKHEPEDADFYEGDLGGAIHGVGIRSRIYWFWWLRSQILAFLMDYLERVGAGGFTIYFFEAGNPESMDEVKTAAEEQWRNNAILFPRYRSGETGGPGIQRIEPSPAGAQLLESLVVEYFDNVIRRFILGQSLTSEAIGTGLGSGVADLHADTFNRIVKFDAVALQETLTKELITVLAKYNFPGIPAPKFTFDVDKPNARAVLDAAQTFFEMGGQVDEDELRGIVGLAKPSPGHAVLAKMPAMSPTGVGALPQGVPMEGQPGPIPGVGADQGPVDPTAGVDGGQEQPFLFNAAGEKVHFARPRQGSIPEGSLPSTMAQSVRKPATDAPALTVDVPKAKGKKPKAPAPTPEEFSDEAFADLVPEITTKDLHEDLFNTADVKERLEKILDWVGPLPGTEEYRAVYKPGSQQKGFKVEHLADLLNAKFVNSLLHTGFGKQLSQLEKKDPKKANALKMAYLVKNSANEIQHFMAKMGPKAGQEWYNEDVEYSEAALIHTINELQDFAPVRGMFGRLDENNRPVYDTPEQQAHMILFKALSTPLSFGHNPVDEYTNAVQVLKNAVQEHGSNYLKKLPRTRGVNEEGKPVHWTRYGLGKNENGAVPGSWAAIEKLVSEFGIVGAAKWLVEDHSKEEIRRIKPNSKLSGPKDEKFKGSAIFGPKGSAYFLNRVGLPQELTMDIWWSRSVYRKLGLLVKRFSDGRIEIADTPKNDTDRAFMRRFAQKVAAKVGLEVRDLQAVDWLREQDLYAKVGAGDGAFSHRDGANNVLKKHGLEFTGFREGSKPSPEARSFARTWATLSGHVGGDDRDRLRDGGGGGSSPVGPQAGEGTQGGERSISTNPVLRRIRHATSPHRLSATLSRPDSPLRLSAHITSTLAYLQAD